MEKLRSDLVKEQGATSTKEDEIYEEIEAPMFVDLTVPNRSPPDDRSWFCARVGCDQTHEEVDPDALYRSFLLRVMAARSPNVRQRTVLDQQAPSLIPKCPQSAPAKPTRSRILRLSTMTSIPEKIAKAKLKDHSISSLRSTPSQAKAKVQPCVSKEALTVPRSQQCPTSREGFRSVRHQTEPVGVVKSRIVVKSLFADTIKERPDRTPPSKCTAPPPVSEVCPEMKKLKVGSRMKNVPSRYLCISTTPKSLKRAYDSTKRLIRVEETKKITKLKSETSSKICNLSEPQETSHTNPNDMQTDEKLDSQSVTATNVEECLELESMQLAKEESTSSNFSKTIENCEKDIEKEVPLRHDASKLASEAQNEVRVTELEDDNKENASATNTRIVNSNTKDHASERFMSATSENVLRKAVTPQSKSSKPCVQRGKHTRTTNPRPFRLRIDERGILKEANQEKRLQINAQAQKKTESIRRCGEGTCKAVISKEKILKEASQEKRLQINAQAQKKTESILRCGEGSCKAVISKEKIAQKAQNSVLKVVVSSRRTLKDKSVTVSKQPQDPQMKRENTKTASPAITSKAKRPATIPKEPIFHRIHLPKGCSKRAEVQG